MWTNFLCRLGFHRWRYINKNRYCLRLGCSAHQRCTHLGWQKLN